ncbi:MAG: hypothetical protein RMX96_27865 [Nostoc sp. ChiSLP02]|nr:hypothetical protein [Nostoc sp. DedSLP05]MDZ8098383.1 hypothetical protein [Nostoc sp. DedSLP01]MDZ8188658.1 hypothetical protein [Nostoc sp. ChiSLP02]
MLSRFFEKIDLAIKYVYVAKVKVTDNIFTFLCALSWNTRVLSYGVIICLLVYPVPEELFANNFTYVGTTKLTVIVPLLRASFLNQPIAVRSCLLSRKAGGRGQGAGGRRQGAVPMK